jgi:hypothetical protein
MKKIHNALIMCALCASFAAAQFSAAGDSVYTKPAKPTTKDSITYNFYDSDACCCAQFVNPIILAEDTEVILSFSVNTTPCQTCACIAAGAWYAFKGGPLAAGRYGIYRQQFIYCAGLVCPQIVLLPVRIGEVVVTNPAAVEQKAPDKTPANGLVLLRTKNTLTLDYSLSQPGTVRIKILDARGICAGGIFDRQATSGLNRFFWTAAMPGVYFMSVETNGAVLAARKIIVSQ